MKFTNSIKTKKILAREFLFFIALLSILLLSIFSFFAFNRLIDYNIDKKEKVKKEKAKNATNLISKYNYKFKTISEHFKYYQRHKNFEFLNDNEIVANWELLSHLAKVDSIKFRWENKWSKELIDGIKEQGYKTPEEFQSFLINNTASEQEKANYLKGYKILDEVKVIDKSITKEKEKKMDDSQLLRTTLSFFLVAFIILFPLRFIFYGTMWSLKTLKKNS